MLWVRPTLVARESRDEQVLLEIGEHTFILKVCFAAKYEESRDGTRPAPPPPPPPKIFFLKYISVYIYIYALILVILFYKITFCPLNNIIDSF